MKAYSIGRELGCDIVINDSTDVISRRHAILNVLPSGKMTIVDSSHNGTYVNGIRITPNVPVPVTRKDSISFAHVARLDWNMIPKPFNLTLYVALGIVVVIFIVGGIFGYRYISPTPEPNPVTPADTTSVVKETPKADEPSKTDSSKTSPVVNEEKKKEKQKTKTTGKKTGNKEGKKGANDKPKDDTTAKKDSSKVSRAARH